ncbi:hypothetical protein [Velocimicrobium porci]|mgnify:CR=1 FL=1|uniref:Uncharacterized protein n=1 Tax=Velocimicrobium porci TaxID=2606634 RepID=A0A6L5XZA3_9FIRM|nr:hypothetical protein [Velocimicrobium porci]MSS64206.1 hypothetical protein [Velocimicrobium porci]
MGIMYEELDDEIALKDLTNVCLTENICVECIKEDCLVGYAKKCLTNCLKDRVTYVENGVENIPIGDTKVYYEEDMATGIANILKICRSCGELHFENCIINVIRSCYEVALFGEEREYHGSAFAYLAKLHEEGKRQADLVVEAYNQKHEK